jgi:hypothetical protein
VNQSRSICERRLQASGPRLGQPRKVLHYFGVPVHTAVFMDGMKRYPNVSAPRGPEARGGLRGEARASRAAPSCSEAAPAGSGGGRCKLGRRTGRAGSATCSCAGGRARERANSMARLALTIIETELHTFGIPLPPGGLRRLRATPAGGGRAAAGAAEIRVQVPELQVRPGLLSTGPGALHSGRSHRQGQQATNDDVLRLVLHRRPRGRAGRRS